jgi:hypothetical protein
MVTLTQSRGLLRCDEWYHTSCVHMPDLEVDLVDQFICPLCVESAYISQPPYAISAHLCEGNPHLDLRTTWKRRCLNGLRQRDPNAPEACHKPARGAFSKYCSDECGVQSLHMRILLWVENGGSFRLFALHQRPSASLTPPRPVLLNYVSLLKSVRFTILKT